MSLLLAGFKPDGSIKVRPIDDLSASKVNATTGVTEKLKYDSLDMFFELLRHVESRMQVASCRTCLFC